MSALLRESILARLHREEIDKRLVITPLLSEQQIGPGSIDLRLGTEFIEVLRRVEASINPFSIDGATLPVREESVFVPLGENFVLHPGQFLLGSTLEYVRLPNDVSGQLLGRSSWGRLGLIVATAIIVHPGFDGMLTLELVNTGSVPIHLFPGLRVAQLQLWVAESKTDLPYGATEEKYRAPLGPQSHRLAWESDELERIQRIGKILAGHD